MLILRLKEMPYIVAMVTTSWNKRVKSSGVRQSKILSPAGLDVDGFILYVSPVRASSAILYKIMNTWSIHYLVQYCLSILYSITWGRTQIQWVVTSRFELGTFACK